MNPANEIAQAGVGWWELLSNKDTWRTRFAPTLPGFALAVLVYVAVVLLGILLQATRTGPPSVAQLIANVALNLLPVCGVGIGIAVSAWTLRIKAPVLSMLVPAVYALAFLLLIGLPLSLLDVQVAPLLLGLTAFMMFRVGRSIAGLGTGMAMAFAALCVVLLVALPLSLYMVIAR